MRSIYVLGHHFGFGHRKDIYIVPFALSLFDFQNEISHDERTFKLLKLLLTPYLKKGGGSNPPTMSPKVATLYGGGGGGK